MRLASLGKGSTIYPYVVIHGAQHVEIGSRVSIAEFVHVWGGGKVIIGDNSIIASHAAITSVTHDIKASVLYRDTVKKMPVKIGKNVWIGSGAVIMPGVNIGDNSVVGAGAVVDRDVEPSTVVVGIPARLLRKIADA